MIMDPVPLQDLLLSVLGDWDPPVSEEACAGIRSIRSARFLRQAIVRVSASAMPVHAPPDPAACLAQAEQALRTDDWPTAASWARAGLRTLGMHYLLQALSGRRTRRLARLLLGSLRYHLSDGVSGEAVPAQVQLAPVLTEPPHRPVVLLCGGIGRMEPEYRTLLEKRGYELVYSERSPARVRREALRPAAVLVITTVISHPLREAAAERAAASRCPIHYLHSPSLTALARGLDALAETGAGTIAHTRGGEGAG